MKRNNLIILNSKFILNNEWRKLLRIEANGVPTFDTGGHSQFCVYYMVGGIHHLKVLDTQMSRSSIGASGEGNNVEKLSGSGENFEKALNNFCNNIWRNINFVISYRFNVVCMMPNIKKILASFQGGGATQKEIVKASLQLCHEHSSVERVNQ